MVRKGLEIRGVSLAPNPFPSSADLQPPGSANERTAGPRTPGTYGVNSRRWRAAESRCRHLLAERSLLSKEAFARNKITRKSLGPLHWAAFAQCLPWAAMALGATHWAHTHCGLSRRPLCLPTAWPPGHHQSLARAAQAAQSVVTQQASLKGRGLGRGQGLKLCWQGSTDLSVT